jgi:hypothetical protein
MEKYTLDYWSKKGKYDFQFSLPPSKEKGKIQDNSK